jgi:hypothetical protein
MVPVSGTSRAGGSTSGAGTAQPGGTVSGGGVAVRWPDEKVIPPPA